MVRKKLGSDLKRAMAWTNTEEVWDKAQNPEKAREAYEKFLEPAPNRSSAGYLKERIWELTQNQ